MMRSLSLFSLALPPPPFSHGKGEVVVSRSKTMEAFLNGLIWAARQTGRQTDPKTVRKTC